MLARNRGCSGGALPEACRQQKTYQKHKKEQTTFQQHIGRKNILARYRAYRWSLFEPLMGMAVEPQSMFQSELLSSNFRSQVQSSIGTYPGLSSKTCLDHTHTHTWITRSKFHADPYYHRLEGHGFDGLCVLETTFIYCTCSSSLPRTLWPCIFVMDSDVHSLSLASSPAMRTRFLPHFGN